VLSAMSSVVNFYLIGNTGVGKSMLLNCLIGEEYFESTWSPGSVTRDTTTKTITADNMQIKFWNLPGILEGDAKKLQENVKHLKKALDSKEKSMVMFVLTLEGGRIGYDDTAAYNSLHHAYQFPEKSMCLLINKATLSDAKKDVVRNYCQRIYGDKKVFFIPNLEEKSFQERCTIVKPIVLKEIKKLVADDIKKVAEFSLDSEAIKTLKETIKKLESIKFCKHESKRLYHEAPQNFHRNCTLHGCGCRGPEGGWDLFRGGRFWPCGRTSDQGCWEHRHDDYQCSFCQGSKPSGCKAQCQTCAQIFYM